MSGSEDTSPLILKLVNIQT